MNNSDDPSSICSQHTERLTIAGIPVDVVRMGVASLGVGVYPPNGQVRVAAPLHVSDEAVQQAVFERLDWIRQQQAGYASPPAETAHEMTTGESLWYLGRCYRLEVVEQAELQGNTASPAVEVIGDIRLRLLVAKGSNREQRTALLNDWYHSELMCLLSPLLQHWQPIIGRQAASCGIKPMATRWGSCNPGSGRIWLNLALVHKPPPCLEYILVHELVHLLERRHGERFDVLLNGFLPDWQARRDTLDQSPLAHPDWRY